MKKRILALLLVSVMLIFPMFSCMVGDTVSTDTTDSGEESQTVDSTNKETEAEETKGSDKATESVNNGEQSNDSNNNDNTTSGDENTGDENTGDENTGDDNTGDDNTGDDNTGDDNTGDDNTGDDNTGDDNTGDDNTGDDNTGDDNTGDDNTGDGGLGEFVPEEVYHNVTYVIDDKGTIEGEAIQRVKEGESSKAVKAVAADGYVFAGWSDGINSDVRSETNVRRDITVFPIFVNENSSYYVSYETRMGGKLIERRELQARADEVITYTAPNAPLAYIHGKWSDGKEGQTRSDNLFSNGMVYVVEIEPYSINEVPSIEIITADGKGIVDKNLKPCTVSLSNAEEKLCFENVSAQIRGRGKSSWTAHEKKGFKIKFDEQRKMPGATYKSKNWNFISNHADKSFIRNMIAYDMSAALGGMGYTTTHEYIDVYINNEYYGFFMMCDDIDVGKGRIEADKTIYDDPSKMAFLLEVGGNHTHNYGTQCFRISRDSNRSCCVKYPDFEDPAYDPDIHLAYITDYVDQCLKALSEQNWEKINELMDIDSFIDHYIVQEVFANKDAFWCSIYFYKLPNGKLYAGPVWDFDQGAGCVPDYFGAGHSDVRPDADINYSNSEVKKTAGTPWVACVNTWYRRLFRNEEFVELFKARFKEAGPIIMKVLEKAEPNNPDGYYALYGDAMERNFERWHIWGSSFFPSTPAIQKIMTVPGQMDYMREWLIERYDVLCDHYDIS